jgi:hypothetical protein
MIDENSKNENVWKVSQVLLFNLLKYAFRYFSSAEQKITLKNENAVVLFQKIFN